MEEYRRQKKYYPVLLYVNGSEEDVLNFYNKYQALPKKNRAILGSDELVSFIYSVEQRFRMRDTETIEFSKLIKKYYFQEITEEEFLQQAAKLSRTNIQDVKMLLRTMKAIIPKIVEDEVKTEEQKIRTEKLSLIDAMAKYPRIKDQEISSNMIVSRPFLQALKPTVKNWVMVYEKILGVSRHDAIERGEFVFRAEATRNLKNEERSLLADILRSRDDRSPVTIDMDAQRIILTQVNDDVIKKSEVESDKNITSKQLVGRVEYPEKKMRLEPKNQSDKKMISQQPYIKKQIDPRKNPIFDELQKEIIKNRAEMTGSAVQTQVVMMGNNSEQSVQKEMYTGKPPVSVAKPGVAASAVQQNIKKEETTSQKSSAISGTIQFSSNHVMPGEKVVQKKLQATKNYFNMSPIGGVHNTTTQKNIQETP